MCDENRQRSCESGGEQGHLCLDEACSCRHSLLVIQQSLQIEELRSKLDAVMAERDVLLCEVSRLKFELEIADLKRINDDRTEESKSSLNGTNSFINENPDSSDQFHNDCSPPSPTYNWSQSMCGKKTLRTNDSSQRNRHQMGYELSQDLLDKQIEMLERKYGGDQARTAALTIQRAFRRYTLLKKFTTITEMAKAEKRFSKRLLGLNEDGQSDLKCLDCFANSSSMTQGSSASLPIRSLSMREKRSVCGPPSLPRSHSGRCELACYSSQTTAFYTVEPYINENKQNSDNLLKPRMTCRVPPEVPKRTSSISIRSFEPNMAHLQKNSDSGSVSSIHSSGSDSSILHTGQNPARKAQSYESSESSSYHLHHSFYKIPDTVRKRQYRVGLNLFNKKPEKGVNYLTKRGFLDNAPQSIARFLISRKGLSKQMIGEYLGNLQDPFNSAVLEYFAQEIDLCGMQIDVALRRFQSYFRMPGEAQKVERVVEVFSQRYCHCNRDMVARLRSLDTVFVLAFAIIMLNTDLHTPNLKPERRMTLEEFIKNLRGVDDCCDIDRNMLIGIYERVKSNEFKPGSDHVTQVMKVQSTIVGKKPNLALPHRRLVCYCRLYEVNDINKKERPGVHQREVFLFNDLLVITKILSKKKNSVTYTFRQSLPLSGLAVSLFEVPYYPFGIRISQRVDSDVLVTFNARNDHDRRKFVEDIKESISEMDEMESLRIEAELEKQKNNRNGRSVNGSSDNRDSGVADVEVCTFIHSESPTSINEPHSSHSSSSLKRSALSNSLLDMHDQTQCSNNTKFHDSSPLYSASIDHSDSL